MPIPVARVDFTGPAPNVNVTVGDALPATYMVSVVPPDHDVSKRVRIADVSDPQQAAAPHSLAPVWPLQKGWVISVIGGIAAVAGKTEYPVSVVLVDSQQQRTDFDVTQAQGTSASTFLAMLELG